MDRSFVEKNRAATERLRKLIASLKPEDMSRPVGEHWTVAVTLAHLAFWERRVQFVLDGTEKAGEVVPVEPGVIVNDLMLTTWQTVPGAEAARLAIETTELVDHRLEEFPEVLLEKVQAYNPRWVLRASHRNEHLDEVDAGLRLKTSN